MAHTELDLRERRTINMLNAKVPVSKIAAEIGRHRSTVYREIKRNYFTDDELPYLSGYYGMVAQRDATKRRARRRKLVRLEDLRAHVVTQLKTGWTPHHPNTQSGQTLRKWATNQTGDGKAGRQADPIRRRLRARRNNPKFGE